MYLSTACDPSRVKSRVTWATVTYMLVLWVVVVTSRCAGARRWRQAVHDVWQFAGRHGTISKRHGSWITHCTVQPRMIKFKTIHGIGLINSKSFIKENGCASQVLNHYTTFGLQYITKMKINTRKLQFHVTSARRNENKTSGNAFKEHQGIKVRGPSHAGIAKLHIVRWRMKRDWLKSKVLQRLLTINYRRHSCIPLPRPPRSSASTDVQTKPRRTSEELNI